MENPYLTVIYKKQRAIRKKLDRISALEIQFQNGKILNEEQLVLYHSKIHIESAMHEMESIKTTMEKIASETTTLENSIPVPIEPASTRDTSTPDVEVMEPIIPSVDSIASTAPNVDSMESSKTSPPSFTDVANDPILLPVLPSIPTQTYRTEDSRTEDSMHVQDTIQAHMRMVLESIHVFHKYSLITGILLHHTYTDILHTVYIQYVYTVYIHIYYYYFSTLLFHRTNIVCR
jgi:hypothetical protein